MYDSLQKSIEYMRKRRLEKTTEPKANEEREGERAKVFGTKLLN